MGYKQIGFLSHFRSSRIRTYREVNWAECDTRCPDARELVLDTPLETPAVSCVIVGKHSALLRA